MLRKLNQRDKHHVFSLTYVDSTFKFIHVGMGVVARGCVCIFSCCMCTFMCLHVPLVCMCSMHKCEL